MWFHGHTHDTYDYMIDQTRILCNPKGYPMQRQSLGIPGQDTPAENPNFNKEKIIEFTY